MKFRKFPFVIFVSASLLISVLGFTYFSESVWARIAWQWCFDSSIVSGLPDQGSYSYPCIAFNFSGDGKWSLISGNGAGTFTGYYWSGANWVSNSSYVAGLGDIGANSCPTIGFNVTGDGKWTLIVGEHDAFYGFYWNGSRWVSDPNRIVGLSINATTWNFSPYLGFNLTYDGVWTLISGEYYGNYYGFYWNGTQWVADQTRVEGLVNLGRYSTVAYAFNVTGNGKWILIAAGGSTGVWRGYYWSGTRWNSDDTYCDGLKPLTSSEGYRGAPTMAFNVRNDQKWVFITGKGDGLFAGYYMQSNQVVIGDWVINSDTTITNQTIILDGNIIVNGTAKATLTLIDTKLYLFLNADGEHGIIVQNGATLNVTGTSVIGSDSKYKYYFRIYGRFYTSGNITISGVGYGGQTQNQGLYIDASSNEVRLSKTLIANAPIGLIINSGRVVLDSVTVSNTTNIAIWTLGGTVTINNSEVTNSFRGIVTDGYSSGTINNTVVHGCSQEGIWIYGSSHFIINKYTGWGNSISLYASHSPEFYVYNSNLTGTGHGVWIQESSSGYFENVTSKGGSYAFYFRGFSSATLVNCTAKNSQSGVVASVYSRITIINSTSQFNSLDGFAFDSNAVGTIQNSVARNNTNGLNIAGAKTYVIKQFVAYNNTNDVKFTGNGMLKLIDSSFQTTFFSSTYGNMTVLYTLTLSIKNSFGSPSNQTVTVYDSFNATKRKPDVNKGVPCTAYFRTATSWVNVTQINIEANGTILGILGALFQNQRNIATISQISKPTSITVILSEEQTPFVANTSSPLSEVTYRNQRLTINFNSSEIVVLKVGASPLNMPLGVYINNVLYSTPLLTKTDFDNAPYTCWYYDQQSVNIYIKIVPHSTTTVIVNWNMSYAPIKQFPPVIPEEKVTYCLPLIFYILLTIMFLAGLYLCCKRETWMVGIFLIPIVLWLILFEPKMPVTQMPITILRLFIVPPWHIYMAIILIIAIAFLFCKR
jgi:hypothetical protein